ncbi:maleylpyruvate isomerase family mycothiol-dependent enzyme [Nocardioides sp.]|uniref:maleylpyruvate isomerase family mycothiol-dependent enzyme n=1 Tax=Nocardioides sp. TaxID=35761 RepID=UPI003526F938
MTLLTPTAYLGHVRRDTDAFAGVLDAATADGSLLARPVPSCPGWTLLDLAHHLGEVHRWVCGAVREGHGETEVSAAPTEPAALATWFRDGAADLLSVLDGDPAHGVWTFHPPATLGFWQRRQAMENVVHRWDAEATLGPPAPVEVALAADGVAEVLDVFIPRRLGHGRLAPLPHAVSLRASDTGDRWVIGPGDPVAELTAPAVTLMLHLWKRIPAEDTGLAWSGDAPAGERLLAMPLTS